VTDELLARARGGDERAFRDLVGPHQRELRLHCYRLLGSLTDAEDALQETLLSAWRGMGRFEARSGWRTWLYRIATNRCLNLIRDRGRQKRTAPVPPFQPPEPSSHHDVDWLEPYPDTLLEFGPETSVQQREAVELVFVTALQRMPPRQAAALVLRDVLDFDTAEVAAMLGLTTIAVKGVLARARAARAGVPAAPTDTPERGRKASSDRELSRRFAEAFVADDVDAVVALLTDDGWLAMPPAPHEYRGPAAVAAFLRASAAWRAPRHFTLVPTRANNQFAYGCYLPDAHHADVAGPAGLIVLTMAGDPTGDPTGDRTGGDRIAGITRFLDNGILARFGLPAQLSVHSGPLAVRSG
jgi:RNA polymerase sigma-70 factor (TIGR02960 family)